MSRVGNRTPEGPSPPCPPPVSYAYARIYLRRHINISFDLDGLDEIFEFSEMYKNNSTHYDIDQEIHWSDIIVNVLRGNLLRQATVVSFSR